MQRATGTPLLVRGEGPSAKRDGHEHAVGVAVAVALVAGGAAVGCWMRRQHVRRSLAGLKSRLDEVLVARGRTPAGEGHDTLPALARAVEEVVALEQQTREQLAWESARREQAEARWRESEQRYALAVRGANDGMWEWDLTSGGAHFSPRWKSILGIAEAERAGALEDWLERIHPADRERVQRELDLHVRRPQRALRDRASLAPLRRLLALGAGSRQRGAPRQRQGQPGWWA